MTHGTRCLYFKFHRDEAHPLLVIAAPYLVASAITAAAYTRRHQAHRMIVGNRQARAFLRESLESARHIVHCRVISNLMRIFQTRVGEIQNPGLRAARR